MPFCITGKEYTGNIIFVIIKFETELRNNAGLVAVSILDIILKRSMNKYLEISAVGTIDFRYGIAWRDNSFIKTFQVWVVSSADDADAVTVLICIVRVGLVEVHSSLSFFLEGFCISI